MDNPKMCLRHIDLDFRSDRNDRRANGEVMTTTSPACRPYLLDYSILSCPKHVNRYKSWQIVPKKAEAVVEGLAERMCRATQVLEGSTRLP